MEEVGWGCKIHGGLGVSHGGLSRVSVWAVGQRQLIALTGSQLLCHLVGESIL